MPKRQSLTRTCDWGNYDVVHLPLWLQGFFSPFWEWVRCQSLWGKISSKSFFFFLFLFCCIFWYVLVFKHLFLVIYACLEADEAGMICKNCEISLPDWEFFIKIGENTYCYPKLGLSLCWSIWWNIPNCTWQTFFIGIRILYQNN